MQTKPENRARIILPTESPSVVTGRKLTLKEFLAEATVKDSASRKKEVFRTIDSKEQAEKLETFLKKRCSAAYEAFLNDGVVIFRGMSRGPDAMQIQYNKGVRKTENTQDYYRMIIDTHPDFDGTDLPKRNRSLIATTDESYAGGYGLEMYLIFPFDDTPIGVIPKNDMFDINFDLFDRSRCNVDNVSMLFSKMFNTYKDDKKGIKTGVITPEQFIKNIDIIGMEGVVNLLQTTPSYQPYLNDEEMGAKEFAQKYGIKDGKTFLEYMYHEVLTPKNLGFKALMPKEFYSGRFLQNEVWMGEKCIAISRSAIDWFKK